MPISPEIIYQALFIQPRGALRRELVAEANSTNNAPKVPYSHTVAFSQHNHISGQLPLNSKTNEIVAGGVKEQAKQCQRNCRKCRPRYG